MVIEGFKGAALVAGGNGDTLASVRSPGIEPDMRFQVASVSKCFAAAVTVILADRGVLGLDDPVGPWDGVTIHRLLSHTAGLGQYRDIPTIDLMAGTVSRALIEAAPLLHEPGSRWHYSSPGYVMLAAAIEKRTGRPYAEIVQDLIVGPLGLDATTVGAKPTTNVAHGEGELDLAHLPGTGDIWSTVADLTRFARRLDPDILATMRTPHATLPEPQLGCGHYGYGLYIGDDTVLHTGDVPGFRSLLAWLPGGRTAGVLTNDESGPGLVTVVRALTSAGDAPGSAGPATG
jgi:CubicO group peptidase (beta-lactamase class C family)